MYGYQSNNSQTYNYQNPNGSSSFANMGQYTGPYHPYYSNATAAYSTFPSNEQPCSSLGVLPQEYSQVGNVMPRPYFYDSNSSYSRSCQRLPFNQPVDIPIANSFNGCPRNCHCCESIKPKYFTPSSAIRPQANTQNACDSTINPTYTGLRKGFDSGLWRDCNNQLPNIHETNDSLPSWSLPKYGSSCKSENCSWPIPQRQPAKCESGDHLSPNVNNTYMLSQQHQKKPLSNNQPYSNFHSNSQILPIQPTLPSSARNEDLLGNCRVGYQYNSFSEFSKNSPDPCSFSKSSLNTIQTSSRQSCNIPGTCGGGFAYRFISPNSKPVPENQKCLSDTPKAVTHIPSALASTFQRRLPSGCNPLDVSKELPYHHSEVHPSVHSIDLHSRRVAFNVSNESETRFILNCNSPTSNDLLPTSRLQLPPIQTFKTTSSVTRNLSRDFNPDSSYIPPKTVQQSNSESEFNHGDLSVIRNVAFINSERFTSNLPSENVCNPPSGNVNDCARINCDAAESIRSEKYLKMKFSCSGGAGTANKPVSNKEISNKHLLPSSGSSTSVMGDLRHFLSTWDDGDEDESNCTAQINPLPNNKNGQEKFIEDHIPTNELPSSVKYLQDESLCSGNKEFCKNSLNHDSCLREGSRVNDDKISQSQQCHILESPVFEVHSFVNSDILDESESIVCNLSINQENLEELETNTEIINKPLDDRRESHFKLKSCENNSHSKTVIHHSVRLQQNEGDGGDLYTMNELDNRDNPVNMKIPNSVVENAPLMKGSLLDLHESEKEAENFSKASNTSSTEVVCSFVAASGTSIAEAEKCMSQLQGPVGEVPAIQTICKTPSLQTNSSEAQILGYEGLKSRSIISKECNMEDSIETKHLINPGSSINLEILEVSKGRASEGLQDSTNLLTTKEFPYSGRMIKCPDKQDDQNKPKSNKTNSSLIENENSIVRDNTIHILASLDSYEAENENISQEMFVDQDNKNISEKVCEKKSVQQQKTYEPVHKFVDSQKINNMKGAYYLEDSLKVSLETEKIIADCENKNETKIFNHQLEKQEKESCASGEISNNWAEMGPSKTKSEYERKEEEKILLETKDADLKNVPGCKSRESCTKEDAKESIILNLKTASNGNGSKALHSKGRYCLKSLKPKSKNLATGLPLNSPCRSVLSIMRKYRTIELRKKIKVKIGMFSKITKDSKLTNTGKKITNKVENITHKENEISINTENVGINNVGKEESNKEKCLRNDCLPNDSCSVMVEKEERCENERQLISSAMNGECDQFLTDKLTFPASNINFLNDENYFEVDGKNITEECKNKNISEPVFIAEEEREIPLENLDRICMIGNVEVFMGTVEDSGSFHEVKEGNFNSNIPDESCLREEANGVQYWNNFDIGNELAVAMEVEVGSEITCDNVLTYMQHEEKENECCVIDAESSNETIISQVNTVCKEEIEVFINQKEHSMESEINKCSSESVDKDIIVSQNKSEISKEDKYRKIALPSGGKTESKHMEYVNKAIDSSVDVLKSRNLLEKEKTKPISCSDALKDKSTKCLSPHLDTYSKTSSEKIMTEEVENRLHRIAPMKNVINSAGDETHCTYHEEKLTNAKETNKMSTKSNSRSVTSLEKTKSSQMFKRLKKKSTDSNASATNLRDGSLQSNQSTIKVKSTVERNCSFSLFKSKKKKLDAEYGTNSCSNFEPKECLMVLNNSECDSKVSDEHGGKSFGSKSQNVNVLPVNTIKETLTKEINISDPECSNLNKHASSAIDGSTCRSLVSPTKVSNDFEKKICLLNKNHETEADEISNENNECHCFLHKKPQCEDEDIFKTDNLTKELVSSNQLNISKKSAPPFSEESSSETKINQQAELKTIKTKASLKSFENAKQLSLKFSRKGFWKSRTWPYHKKYNKSIKCNTPAKWFPKFKDNCTLSVPSLPTKQQQLPFILDPDLAPPPPPLSPLPVLTTPILTSDSDCHVVSLSNQSQLDFPLSSVSSCTQEKNCSNHDSHCPFTNKQYFNNNSSDPMSMHTKPNISEPNQFNDLDVNSICQPTTCSKSKTPVNSVLSSDSSLESTSENGVDSYIYKPETKIASDISLLKDTFSIKSKIKLCDNSHSLEINASSEASGSVDAFCDVPLNVACSNQNGPPRVCITFKKVGIGHKKKIYVKSPTLEDSSDKKSNSNREEIKKRDPFHHVEHETPLPKVTIKKKTGQKGYQSFLSGFSSASSSPSSSPTAISIFPASAPIKAESCMEIHQDIVEENINGKSIQQESFQAVSMIRCNYSSNSIQDRISNNNTVPDTRTECFGNNDDFKNGVVQKKEGSGLVFVIRGLGNKVKACSSKDVLKEQRPTSPKENQVPEKDSNNFVSSECSVSSGDDEWESGPWSIWQPVVKLSRSCELDALARELHSMDDEKPELKKIEFHTKSKDLQDDPAKSSKKHKSFVSKLTSRASHSVKSKIESNYSNNEKFSKIRTGNEDYERKIHNDRIETDWKKHDRMKEEIKLQKSNEKDIQEKSITPLADLTKKDLPRPNIACGDKSGKGSEINEMNLQSSDFGFCGSLKRKKILKQTKPSSKGILEERKHTEEKLFGSCPKSKKLHAKIRSGEKEGNKEKPCQIEKYNKTVNEVRNDNTVTFEKDGTTNSQNKDTKKISKLHLKKNSQEVSLRNSVLENIPVEEVVKEKVFEREKKKRIGNASSSKPKFLKRDLSKEKRTIRELPSENEKNLIILPSEGIVKHSFRCEVCCRSFSTVKWLSRHCKGLSHCRVQNAQRQAVQALLLLLTGNESTLLPKLSEKELSHMKKWPLHAVPSPLQVALKELLRPD